MVSLVGPEMVTTTERVVHKVVLTGGPCAGKTTALSRIRTFFENLGWKVYTVPETATILLGGGVKVNELDAEQVKQFQVNIVKTILQIEQTFFDLASRDSDNCILVCDRGVMDPSAFCTDDEWQELLKQNDLDQINIRDERYDQIIHMVTAANGAENFYQLSNNAVRIEGIEQARDRDHNAAQAWVGHPYYDVIDNSTDFENKVRRVIEIICKRLGKRLGVSVDDRLQAQSKKRKFLIASLPADEAFPLHFKDFDVRHDLLLNNDPNTQVRIRKRGQQRGNFTYTNTKRTIVNGEKMELIRQITRREYELLLKQADPSHYPILKTRRCFLWQGNYFQLDIFKEPTARCNNLILLETYTSIIGDIELPKFIEVVREVTNETEYTLFYLSSVQ